MTKNVFADMTDAQIRRDIAVMQRRNEENALHIANNERSIARMKQELEDRKPR